MTAQPITHVSDTARWVAWYRAMESERPDAIFRDPYARRLAGARGEAIVKAMPRGEAMAWPMIVRTALMDEIINRLVGTERVDCVLNLAAGLDARPWRLPLPPTLRWVDVDHAVMLDLKEKELANERPACIYEAVRLDLGDINGRRGLFARIGESVRRALVVTEGLLIYLTPEAVTDLALDLHVQRSSAFWLTDVASPALLKMLSKNWGPVVARGNAPFRFGPAESTRFFEPYGWKEVEYRSMFDESIRLKRTMRMAGFWKFVGKFFPRKKREEFKRFSGVALLERT